MWVPSERPFTPPQRTGSKIHSIFTPPIYTPPFLPSKKTPAFSEHLPTGKKDTSIFQTPAHRSHLHSASSQRLPATIARSPKDSLRPVGKMTDNAREIKNETLPNFLDHHFCLTTSSIEKMTRGENKLRRGELLAQKQGSCPAISRCWTARTVGFAVDQVKLRRFQVGICRIHFITG